MSQSDQVPPWLREQLARFEQLQQNLQAILVQKQQVDIDSTELERALAELKKSGPQDAVYKSAGSVLIKSNRDDLVKELEEKKELSSTRSTVLAKQEARVRENIKELQAKIEDALKGRTATPASS